MDYPYAKLGDFIVRRFSFIVRSETDTHTESYGIRDAVKRFTSATVVGVSDKN